MGEEFLGMGSLSDEYLKTSTCKSPEAGSAFCAAGKEAW